MRMMLLSMNGWRRLNLYCRPRYYSAVDMFAQDVLVLGFNVTLEGTWPISTSLKRLGAMSSTMWHVKVTVLGYGLDVCVRYTGRQCL
jgi:hypothetical protein